MRDRGDSSSQAAASSLRAALRPLKMLAAVLAAVAAAQAGVALWRKRAWLRLLSQITCEFSSRRSTGTTCVVLSCLCSAQLVALNPVRAQDGSLWNDPLCCTPWPQTVFFNYYLEDASIEGGCLKVMCVQQRPRADSLSPC